MFGISSVLCWHHYLFEESKILNSLYFGEDVLQNGFAALNEFCSAIRGYWVTMARDNSNKISVLCKSDQPLPKRLGILQTRLEYRSN
jgi:hypothetical protein